MDACALCQFLLRNADLVAKTPDISGKNANKSGFMWLYAHLPNVAYCILWFYILRLAICLAATFGCIYGVSIKGSDRAVMYNMLEKSIYRNSRYELIQLLEDIYPTKQGKFKNANAFDEIANAYELLINKNFPALLLSEERLVIFSRVYSEHGVISQALVQAFESGIRATIFSVLQKVSVTEEQHYINLKRRRFYEAEIFGLFDNPNAVTEKEIETV